MDFAPFWTRMGLKSSDWCPWKKRGGMTEGDRDTQRDKDPTMTEVEAEEHSHKLRHTKGCQGHQELGEALRDFLRAFIGGVALPAP
jgi:hypothetical protein